MLVSDGPRPVRGYCGGELVTVPVPAAEVIDTVGAGDSFGGAFLSWWAAHGCSRADLGRPGQVQTAIRAAAEVAALTCARAGADPPRSAELAGRPGWD